MMKEEDEKKNGVKVYEADISDLVPDDHNFNKGTEYGSKLLEDSMRKFGAGRSVLIDKNNRLIGGNKATETAGAIDLNGVIIVETDGTKLVAVKRTDVDLDTKEGREMALADNAVGKANLEWDEDELRAMQDEFDFDGGDWGVDMSKELDEEEQKKEKECPEVKFTEVLNEEHNYIVLYFDNEVDWLQAESLFDIETVQCFPTAKGKKGEKQPPRYGVGRVLKGAEALDKIKKAYENIN